MNNVQTTIVLEPTTSAVASDSFIVGNAPGVTVICAGLQGGETATVQFFEPISNTWINYVPPGATAPIVFTNIINLYDVWDTAGTYRVNKILTANPVGISVSRFLD